jgi:amidohydrolase
MPMRLLLFLFAFASCCGSPLAQGTPLRAAIDADYPLLEGLFRHFHANPELSLQEVETSKRLAAELDALGYDVTSGVGRTGVVALLRNGEGPQLMIRADMDALPVQEKTGLAYASSQRQIDLEGQDVPVMHACGHDMHITTLIGVARRMVAMKDRWRGTLMLVGQPAEEQLGGAKGMVADRLYERFGRPDFALALHVIAKYPAGRIAFSDGLMYSSADTVTITVRGRATHGAAPHLGNDPVVVGSQIVLALQNIVTREVSPIEPALISVGAFNAGIAPNVIADQARLELTVRANSEETRRRLLAGIERVALNTARAAGVAESLLPLVRVHDDGAPTTRNDAALAQRVRAAMRAGMGDGAFVPWAQTDMGAEDFPDLVGIDPPIPSVYFEVGGTPPEQLASGEWAEHHSPLFRIAPEPSIKAGVEAMTLAALDLLGTSASTP